MCQQFVETQTPLNGMIPFQHGYCEQCLLEHRYHPADFMIIYSDMSDLSVCVTHLELEMPFTQHSATGVHAVYDWRNDRFLHEEERSLVR